MFTAKSGNTGATDSGCDSFLAKINELIVSFIKRGNQYERKGNTLPWMIDERRELVKERGRMLKNG